MASRNAVNFLVVFVKSSVGAVTCSSIGNGSDSNYDYLYSDVDSLLRKRLDHTIACRVMLTIRSPLHGAQFSPVAGEQHRLHSGEDGPALPGLGTGLLATERWVA